MATAASPPAPEAGAAPPSEAQRYAHGLKYSLYDTLSTAVLGVVSTVLTARVFGAEVIGAFALASLLTGSLHMLSNVREQGGLVRELTRFEPRSRETRALTWVTLGFSAALTIVVLAPFSVLAVYLLRETFEHPELVVCFAVLAAGYLVLDNTAVAIESALVAYRDGRSVWFAHLAMALGTIGGAVACWLAGFTSVWGLVGCTLASWGLGLVVRVLAVQRLCGLRADRASLRWAVGRMRTIISFGLRATPLNYSETAMEYADTAILGATVSLAGVGAYSRAYGLYRRAGGLVTSMSRLYFPTLSALFHQGDRVGMARVYRISSRFLALALAPLATGLAAAAPGIMGIFGPGFEQAAPAFSILVAIVVLDGYSRLAGGVLSASNRPGVVSLLAVLSAVANVALCFALIPSLGLTGAALANLGAWLVMVPIMLALAAGQLERGLAFMLDPAYLVRLAGACAVLAAALVVLRELPGALVWQVLASLPALALGLLVFRPLEADDVGAAARALGSAGLRSPRAQGIARRALERIARGARGEPLDGFYAETRS